MHPRPALSERSLLFIIGAIQFVNILDFMMVMPLGPDFAGELGIDTSKLGVVGGSYAISAAISGAVGATFLDRFDRRKALLWALSGLILGTALGGLAGGFGSLIAARVVAGAFGGPSTSLAMAIIADVVPPARRGRAMGAVMGAFSVASVLGVPVGLRLSTWGGFRLPFFAVAGLGAAVALCAAFALPPLTSHLKLAQARSVGGFGELLRDPTVRISLVGTVIAMLGQFALIPNLSAYFQFNLGYPRDKLDLLYWIGGLVSFATLRLAGRLSDRLGPSKAAAIGSVLYVANLIVGFIHPVAAVPVMVVFVMFMVTGSFRFVPMQALASRVPPAAERARFMSVQSFVQHLSSAAGAMIASQILTSRPDGGLEGMARVATLTAVLSLLLPMVMALVEVRVRAKERDVAAGDPVRAREVAALGPAREQSEAAPQAE
jgi:predicted MFS family arabinose efflux permease